MILLSGCRQMDWKPEVAGCYNPDTVYHYDGNTENLGTTSEKKHLYSSTYFSSWFPLTSFFTL